MFIYFSLILYVSYTQIFCKPQNLGSLDRYWINIIKIIYKIKPSPKIGIEPGCTWSSSRLTSRWSSRRTPRCSSSKRPWNLLSHEILVSWNLQMISEDRNPKGFYVWMMQPKASESELYILVIWSMIQTGSQRHETNIDPASVQTMFKYYKMMAIHSPLTAGIDCCYLSYGIFHFIRNFVNLTILSLS